MSPMHVTLKAGVKDGFVVHTYTASTAQAYTTSTARDICTLAVLCSVFVLWSVFRPFLSLHAQASQAQNTWRLHEFAFEGTNYAKVCLKTLLCFLQLSDRAYVSLARCISFFLLIVLVPHDSNVAVYAQVC